MSTRPPTATMIHDDFIRAMQHLAELSTPDVITQLPDLAAFPLHHHLVALGMSATIVTKSHMHALNNGRYRLIVRSRANSEVSLSAQHRTSGTARGVGLSVIWDEVLYSADGTTLRPETAALLTAHVTSDLHAGEGERVTAFYSTLRDTLKEEPYDSALRQIAHLPLMLFEVEGEGQYTAHEDIDAEVQRRLGVLYPRQDSTPLPVSPPAALKA